MFVISCAFIGLLLFIVGSSGNGLCILVFLRKKFRHRVITPYFIVLLFADSIYLLFHLIKLFYYSQTLFNLNIQPEESCSTTFFARAYQYATQTWPQPLVPLVHAETYIRFSLILMCIISLHRTTYITRSLKRLVIPTSYSYVQKHKWTFIFIILAFFFAYIFEFVGLTLFCSKSNTRDLSYEWFIYMSTYMKNSTYLLTSTMVDQPDSLKCVNYALKNLQETNQSSIIYNNDICTEEQLINILSYYFDQHKKSIVNLIQKILLNQTGQRITRNEIRRKFHFHECLFPQEPNFFHRYYNFMYRRSFGFNRHTLLLVIGSVLPSFITIISNILSVYRVRELRRSTSNYILPCRRRTDDTRRVLLVITIECLFAIINSWFSDILLSLVYCKRNLLADDDCPNFLKQNINLLIMFDMFNSLSNIILHCLCGKHFRNELYLMFQSCGRIIKRLFRAICCCYIRIRCQSYSQEQYVWYNASITGNNSSNSSQKSISPSHLYLKIHTSPQLSKRHCFDCQWYFNRRPLMASREFFSAISKECLGKNRKHFSTYYQPLSARTDIKTMTTSNSMKLYFPQQETTTVPSKNKRWFSFF
ncbi:unnamed protein product [Rotaria sp. Silwood1]|nr:unnamed protein product [Rotaria sp. Silwood1]CAF1361315.1 unnamed protein product [Rotaria sp. Silwood1]CAF3573932.1 unnamed protein product [Rotaria sp. Silwood1]CAF4648988.1 unnamed protein product [Rotaria sp. Silwood1]CAF4692098.1 unnamed protein product [Rotaria sp. Silwood1]